MTSIATMTNVHGIKYFMERELADIIQLKVNDYIWHNGIYMSFKDTKFDAHGTFYRIVAINDNKFSVALIENRDALVYYRFIKKDTGVATHVMTIMNNKTKSLFGYTINEICQ